MYVIQVFPLRYQRLNALLPSIHLSYKRAKHNLQGLMEGCTQTSALS